MIPFTVMRLGLKAVEIYLNRVRRVRHPVRSVFTFDTSVHSTKVLLVPALWDNYSYIVLSNGQAAIVDPSEHTLTTRQLDERKISPSHILVTHDHIDHIASVAALHRRYGSTIVASKGCSIPHMGAGVENGWTVRVGEAVIEALSVPGHHAVPYPISNLENNISWYDGKAGILFTGDALFSAGYGYTAPGHERTMWESLRRIRALPEQTLIFCGHEYTLRNTLRAVTMDPENSAIRERLIKVRQLVRAHRPTVPTTLRLEKEINPFLRWDDRLLKERLGIPDNDDFSTFLHIREIYRSGGSHAGIGKRGSIS